MVAVLTDYENIPAIDIKTNKVARPEGFPSLRTSISLRTPFRTSSHQNCGLVDIPESSLPFYVSL
jgi:hypothetical protein